MACHRRHDLGVRRHVELRGDHARRSDLPHSGEHPARRACRERGSRQSARRRLRLQGNGHFQQRVEFTTAVGWYFGQRWYCITLVLFNVSLVFGNLASIVVSAQVRRGADPFTPSRSSDDAHIRRPSRARRR